jgi:predicted secreted Zn-dependent protease
VGLGLAALPSGSFAAVEETFRYVHYGVTPQPGVNLLTLLNEATPIRQGGHRYHGYTEWHVRWHFQWLESPSGTCRITSVVTHLDTKITLPDPNDRSLTDQPGFAGYFAALERHEHGHYENGRAAARAIDQGIAALPAEDSCDALGRTANDFGASILREANEKDKEYDRTTRHGATQGATLSP